MANARVKRVLGALADLYSRPRYIADYLSSLREPLFRGDTIEVPSIGVLTIAQASVGQVAQDVANQAVNPNVLSLVANQEPAIFVEVQSNQDVQVMDGAYFDQVAFQGLAQLRNSIDGTLASTMAQQTAFDTVGTYHDNPAGGSLTAKLIASSKAALLAQDGAHALALFVSAWGEASIQSISNFIPNFQKSEQGQLGIPFLGTVFGIPVFQSNAILTAPAFASVAGTIASNVATYTLGANHGIVPGQMITAPASSGFTTGTAAPTAVSTVTATTVAIPLTGSNGSIGTGTVTEQSSWNMMLDLAHLYVALQKLPSVREVPYYNRTSNSLQMSAIYGSAFRAAKARVLHSPPTSA